MAGKCWIGNCENEITLRNCTACEMLSINQSINQPEILKWLE